jgi:hypothetical protein
MISGMQIDTAIKFHSQLLQVVVDLFLAEREVTTSLSERSWLEEYQVCKIAYLGAFSLRLGIVIGIGGSEFRETRIMMVHKVVIL